MNMKWLRTCRLCAEEYGLQEDEEGKSQIGGYSQAGQYDTALLHHWNSHHGSITTQSHTRLKFTYELFSWRLSNNCRRGFTACASDTSSRVMTADGVNVTSRQRGVHIEGWFGAVWRFAPCVALLLRALASLLHSDLPSPYLGFFGPSDGGERTRLSTFCVYTCMCVFVCMCVCVQVIGYRRPHTTPLMKGYHSNGVTVKRTIGTWRWNFNRS